MTTKVGRYKTPEESGRITPPIPDDVRRSPSWWGPMSIGLLLLGLLICLLNWITLLPGAYSPWYLLAGFGVGAVGFAMLAKFH